MPSSIPNAITAGKIPQPNDLIFRYVHEDTFFNSKPVSLVAVIKDTNNRLMYGPGGSVPPFIDDSLLNLNNFPNAAAMFAAWLEIAKLISMTPMDDSERPVAPGYTYGPSNLIDNVTQKPIGWYAPRFRISDNNNEVPGFLDTKVSGSITVRGIPQNATYLGYGHNGIFYAATLVNDKHFTELKGGEFYCTNQQGIKGWYRPEDLTNATGVKHHFLNINLPDPKPPELANLHQDTATFTDHSTVQSDCTVRSKNNKWERVTGDIGNIFGRFTTDEVRFGNMNPTGGHITRDSETNKLQLLNDIEDVSNKFYGGPFFTARWVRKDNPCDTGSGGGGGGSGGGGGGGGGGSGGGGQPICRCYPPRLIASTPHMYVMTYCRDATTLETTQCPGYCWWYIDSTMAAQFVSGSCPADMSRTDPGTSNPGPTGGGTTWAGAICPYPPGYTPPCRCDIHEAIRASQITLLPLPENGVQIPCHRSSNDTCLLGIHCRLKGQLIAEHNTYVVYVDMENSSCPPPNWGTAVWLYVNNCRNGAPGWRLVGASCENKRLPCPPPLVDTNKLNTNNLKVIFPCIACDCPTAHLDCDGNTGNRCPEFMEPEAETTTTGSCSDMVIDVTFQQGQWHRLFCIGNLQENTVFWYLGMIGGIKNDAGEDFEIDYAMVEYDHSGVEHRYLHERVPIRARMHLYSNVAGDVSVYRIYNAIAAPEHIMVPSLSGPSLGRYHPLRRMCVAVRGPGGRKARFAVRNLSWKKPLE